MATPLIIGAAIAGLLPLGLLAGRSNKQIIEKLNMLPKRNQQLSKIKELWKSSITPDGNDEQSEIILNNFINLCETVVDNNESKNNENINIELLQELQKYKSETFTNIPETLLVKTKVRFKNISTNLTKLIDNYNKYLDDQNKTQAIISGQMSSNPLEVYEYVTKQLQLPFHILIRSTAGGVREAPICELMVESRKISEEPDEMYESIKKTYVDNYNSLLSTVYYSIYKLSENDEYDVKVKTLKDKIIKLEETYRDDLAKQAIALYPYYFDINRDEKTQLDDYLVGLNVKISGLVSMPNLGVLSSVLDENNKKGRKKKIYSNSFEHFIRFVKNDLKKQSKKNAIVVQLKKRERDKKQKNILDNEDDDLLLLMLIMEHE